jgi:hypothetical protein
LQVEVDNKEIVAGKNEDSNHYNNEVVIEEKGSKQSSRVKEIVTEPQHQIRLLKKKRTIAVLKRGEQLIATT